MFVSMPFTGFWNKWGKAPPGGHEVWDDQRLAEWSTDLFAAPGTAVRPRIFGPLGVYDVLKVRRKWTGRAGTGVEIGVYHRSGTLVGTVSYAHLDRVSVAPGQTVTSATVLGYLKRWDYIDYVWEVDEDDEVHTHIEVGTVGTPTSCWRGIRAGLLVGESNWIGKIIPGKNAIC